MINTYKRTETTMSNYVTHELLEKLAILRRTYWLQNFTFTPEQAAQYNALRRARWDRVRQLTAA